MKVLILSRVFPAYHPQRGEPTGFREKFLSGEKIHTIRANEKSYYKDGDVVSIREWEGKPYASKQRVIQDKVKIRIEPIVFDCVSLRAQVPYGVRLRKIASNDGLSFSDFRAWFFPAGRALNDFVGDIVHFQGAVYGDLKAGADQNERDARSTFEANSELETRNS